MPPTPLLMIDNENEFSLNENEIGFIDKIGGIKELFSYLNMKKSNIPSIKILINILFPGLKSNRDRDIAIKNLLFITNDPEGQYNTIYITKSNGKKREINKPDCFLKKFQKAIYKNILLHIPISDYAAAYKKGSSLKDSTAVHIGKPMVLKLDIKNFFGSILYKTVQEMFLKQGYDYFMATTLATLCCYKGSLPQGTSTSPAISNIVMREFDEKMAEFCNGKDIAYTRYSDDMTFSGDFDKNEIISFAENNLADLGFILNKKKTRLIKQGQRQTVTGIVVNEKQQLPKDYRKQIRQEIYYCRKYSVKSHILHANLTAYIRPNGDVYYKEYLLNLYGRINYVLQINPVDSEMLEYKSIAKSAVDNLDIVKRKINDEIFNLAAEFYKNDRYQTDSIYSYLKESGYTDEEINYSGLNKAYNLKYDSVYDDKNNIIGLMNSTDNTIINKNYDTFFGFNFDQSLKYIILTLDKNLVFKANKLGIKNVVSFLAKPNHFLLTQNKLDFIRKYGNTVILHGSDNEYFDSIKQILLSNRVNIL